MRTLFSIRFVACCIFRDEDEPRGSGETSFAGEIKKEEQMWHHRAGETRDLWMFTDIYRMQYIKKHMLLHDLIASKFRESTN